MNIKFRLALVLFVLSLSTAMAFSGWAASTGGYGDRLGTVEMPFACKDTSSATAQEGLALLHHMTYTGARSVFKALSEEDPDCAMGYWGEAMTYIHPLWSDPPSKEEFELGKVLLEKAAAKAKGERETAFVNAVKAYYDKGINKNEKVNLNAFAQAWEEAYKKFPEDTEAASFHALSNLGRASHGDKTYARQKQSGEVAAKVLKKIPDHPGAHHYTIHAYDSAALATQAVEVARNYSKIAPAVPHALHMPAHIFTRLGLWEDSIDLNRRSADAALKHPAGDKISLHYLHALDYLAYAFLQRGEDSKANEVLEELTALKGPYQPHVASAYTFAAVPARLALERKKWAAAAALDAQMPRNYSWEINPAMEAITYFARGLGGARGADKDLTLDSIRQMKALEKRTADKSAYWAKQVKIQRLSVEAWLSYMEGDKAGGLKTMTEAAELEAGTDKHPVTPGEVIPAHELLADMLFDSGDLAKAHSYYKATLDRSPNRLLSIYGAARSAELMGNKKVAAKFYQELLDMVSENAQVEQVKLAKDYLKGI